MSSDASDPGHAYDRFLSIAMPVLLISLRNVPDDEAAEIRALLDTNRFEFYETPAGRWGISAPAIWLKEQQDLKPAKALIEEYQKERFSRQRAEYDRLKREGKNKTLGDVIREEPIRFLLYLAIVAMVLYFSIKPFFALGK